MENLSPFSSEEAQPQEQNDGKDQFNPSEWERFACPRCGCPLFEQKVALLRRSPLRDANGEEKFKPGITFICNKCSWELGTNA